MQVDILALVASAILYFILGMLWYSKVLFGNIWMKAFKFDEQECCNHSKGAGKVDMYKGMIFSLIGAFLTSFSLMQFFIFGNGDIASNIRYSLMAWLGFVSATQMGSVYFNFWDKHPGKIFFITTGYYLVGFILIAIIQAIL
jgi:hypothetical protein